MDKILRRLNQYHSYWFRVSGVPEFVFRIAMITYDADGGTVYFTSGAKWDFAELPQMEVAENPLAGWIEF